MPRRRRRSTAVLAGVSLLLCVAALALWVRSYWIADNAFLGGPTRDLAMGSAHGSISLVWGPRYRGPNAFFEPEGFEYHKDVINPSMHFDLSGSTWHAMARWGFGYDADRRVTAHTRIGPMTYNTGTRLYVPHWLFALAFAASPIAWSIRRYRRPLPGRCQRCGYDLRATPDRCPECGDAAL